MDILKEKVAIVTGGASGIGRALCERLGEIGAIVTVTDINAEGTELVSKKINENGGQARAEQLDVSRAGEVANVIEKVYSEYKRLDYIFNNAGILIVGETYDMNIGDWNRIIDINLKGVIFGIAAAYPIMIEQRFGHIVNMSSYQGLIPSGASTAYAATKHGIVGLSASLRSEAEHFGVKVSVVCPGFIRTPIYETANVLKANREAAFSKIPFGLLDVDEAAEIILIGVVKNKKTIIFPFYARFFWWLYRVHPILASPFVNGLIKEFRNLKSETA